MKAELEKKLEAAVIALAIEHDVSLVALLDCVRVAYDTGLRDALRDAPRRDAYPGPPVRERGDLMCAHLNVEPARRVPGLSCVDCGAVLRRVVRDAEQAGHAAVAKRREEKRASLDEMTAELASMRAREALVDAVILAALDWIDKGTVSLRIPDKLRDAVVALAAAKEVDRAPGWR